jgi:hypothetical protein
MRLYYRPPGSPVGVSTGSIGTLIIGALWLVVILFYTFFIWPFQFIWVSLPREFPNSKNLPGWQLGLTIAYVGFLVVAIIIGSHSGGSSSVGAPDFGAVTTTTANPGTAPSPTGTTGSGPTSSGSGMGNSGSGPFTSTRGTVWAHLSGARQTQMARKWLSYNNNGQTNEDIYPLGSTSVALLVSGTDGFIAHPNTWGGTYADNNNYMTERPGTSAPLNEIFDWVASTLFTRASDQATGNG